MSAHDEAMPTAPSALAHILDRATITVVHQSSRWQAHDCPAVYTLGAGGRLVRIGQHLRIDPAQFAPTISAPFAADPARPPVSKILLSCSDTTKRAKGLPACYLTITLELRVDGKLVHDLDIPLTNEEKEELRQAFDLQLQSADFSLAEQPKSSPKAGGGKAGGGKAKAGAKAEGGAGPMAQTSTPWVNSLVHHYDAAAVRVNLREFNHKSILVWAQVRDPRVTHALDLE
jgi:hypothetical protein